MYLSQGHQEVCPALYKRLVCDLPFPPRSEPNGISSGCEAVEYESRPQGLEGGLVAQAVLAALHHQL